MNSRLFTFPDLSYHPQWMMFKSYWVRANGRVAKLLLLFILLSCNPYGTPAPAEESFGEKDSGQELTFDLDLIDDDDSSLGFGGATHKGTSFSEGTISLDTSTNLSELDASWTPKWMQLAAYYQFEDSPWNGTPGEVKDSVGENHGVRMGGASLTADSKIGNFAATFSGSGDFIDAGLMDLSDLQAASVSLWFKNTSLGSSNQRAFEFGTPATRIGVVQKTAGYLELYIIVADSVCDSLVVPISYMDGGWHHLAFVVSSSGQKIYVDGNLVVFSSSDCTPFNLDSSSKVYIGQYVGGGDYDWKGELDDVAFWKAALSDDEVALIYSRQAAKFAGEMVSRVMNSYNQSATWSGISWKAALPFSKELPGEADEPLSYSTLLTAGAVDLFDGLVAAWHFNEKTLDAAPTGSDFEDSIGTYHATESGGVKLGVAGRFGHGIELDGVDDKIITANLPLEDKGSIAMWIRDDGQNSDHRFLFESTGDARYLLYQVKNTNQFQLWMGGIRVSNATLDGLIDSKDWIHIVVTYDLSHPTKKQIVYKNGIEYTSFNTAFTPGTPSEFYLGSRFTDQYWWSGTIDEFGFWSRPLSAEEVKVLYGRGANRVKLQVRTCSLSDCSDKLSDVSEGWMGPGGDGLTYFSELYNNSLTSSSCSIPQSCAAGELQLEGFVQALSAAMLFSEFGSDGIQAPSGQYFQYKVILESDDTGMACDSDGVGNDYDAICLPQLESVEVKLAP